MTAAEQWTRGLIASAVNGGASAVTLIVLDPMTFNLQEGWRKLLTGTAVFTVIALANFLKQHPLPEWDGVDRRE